MFTRVFGFVVGVFADTAGKWAVFVFILVWMVGWMVVISW